MCKVRAEAVRCVANAITGLDMCTVCTEAVHCVALWTRTLSQVWTCVKYVHWIRRMQKKWHETPSANIHVPPTTWLHVACRAWLHVACMSPADLPEGAVKKAQLQGRSGAGAHRWQRFVSLFSFWLGFPSFVCLFLMDMTNYQDLPRKVVVWCRFQIVSDCQWSGPKKTATSDQHLRMPQTFKDLRSAKVLPVFTIYICCTQNIHLLQHYIVTAGSLQKVSKGHVVWQILIWKVKRTNTFIGKCWYSIFLVRPFCKKMQHPF